MKIRLKYIALLFLVICRTAVWASPQMPDYIIYKKDTIVTYNLLLEQYLQKLDTAKTNQLFGLNFRNGSSLNCWRGYQAIYKIENDSLFLVDIINCGQIKSKTFDRKQSVEKMKSIFGAQLQNGKVFMDWIDRIVNFPLTNKTLRWDGVFYKIFEREKLISISKGLVSNTEDVENYVDDPKRIDRRDRNKVSDILFKKLKKANWKNSNDFDCASKYWVTINENGNISNVRMTYTDKEIEEFYEKNEYNFCISKMLNTLKDLKFDIIKNKGEPISEDIYIEIWMKDNGKIENWTR